MFKKLFKFSIYTIIIVCLYYYHNEITDYIASLIENKPKVVIDTPNIYFKNKSYDYVKQSENFIPYSKSDLKNIIYSVLDRGYETFTFYCPNEYTECINDFEEITNDSYIISIISGFVSPYNNFKNIKREIYSSGEITLSITKLYSNEDINIINNEIEKILKEITNDEMSQEDKILAIHDYIINKTKYDKAKVDDNSTYKSDTAYGPLLEGYAICAGYSDAMALFLDKLEIDNYKIATNTHTWNAVKIKDKWYHLDLTWDDPIDETYGQDTLSHSFYLIDNNKLKEYDMSDHTFDETIYTELS